MRFKSSFQEANLDIEEIEQTDRAAGYGSSNNVNHSEMEDAFTNLASATTARDTAFNKITTANGNL